MQAGLEQALQMLDSIETQPLLGHVERAFVQLAGDRTGLAERWLDIHPPPPEPGAALQAEELSQMREDLAILQDRFAALSGSIGPVLNRLGDDIEAVGAQLRELLVLQAHANKAVRQPGRNTPVDEATALASVQAAYRDLQDLRFSIAQEMGQLEPDFRFYHCIVYRELIVQALRQQEGPPVAVGFGISGPEQARQVRGWGADGAIVGSALVKVMAAAHAAGDDVAAAAGAFCTTLRDGLDRP